MGFLWDLIQHSQIQDQGRRTGTLESRIDRLEGEVGELRRVLAEALKRLESRLDADLDGDGSVGR